MLWLGVELLRATFGVTVPDDLCVESLISETVALAARLPLEERTQPPTWLLRVLDKLHAEHCRRLTLGELSREARVHPVHLSRVFRRFVREGIGEYVHRLRARTACLQLLQPELSLSEISLATGFADQSHFTRAFRKIAGVTPEGVPRSDPADIASESSTSFSLWPFAIATFPQFQPRSAIHFHTRHSRKPVLQESNGQAHLFR